MLVEEVNLIGGSSVSKLVVESGFICTVLAEIGEEIDEVDVPAGNLSSRGGRRTEEDSNGSNGL